MPQTSPSFASVDEYVASRGGSRAIRKVLIANNGIGAVKAIRSIRRFAYEALGNERAITFVVMATPEDMRANAEYIRMADEIVDVPGGTNNNNYANVMLIVEIAERWGVDAVWAGWGHASENPRLPDALEKTARNIVFIGPPGPPMRALGDKIGSTIIAQSAGVPCIAWNGDGLMCKYADGGIPPELYAKANVTTAEQALDVCKRVGFPVMIKASEGGGGKGIRKVLSEDKVLASYRQVASEIPGSPIFVMKLAPRSRHLEVQLLADHHGQAIALNGRDCSVQRRHQKIIEEGPPIVAPKEVWRRMEKAAISLAKEVAYWNAGTVEYLYTDEGFFFLELNPRLQVEHPVTEMVTKVNLPAAQLQVAMGIPLHLIPDIRRYYGRDAFGTEPIDFDNDEPPPPRGHCIAVRITAENPDQGFQPTSGTIQELNFRSTPDVWGYFSVDSSGLVHEFADSQFGHLFAGGVDREAARKNMIIALKELSIRGDIRTTVEYIVDMMGSSDFKENRIDTAWLDARISEGRSGEVVKRTSLATGLVVTVAAATSAHRDAARRSESFCDMVSKGLLPPRELLETSHPMTLIYEGLKYCLTVSQAGPKTFTVECNGAYAQAECRSLADGGFLVVVAGKSHVCYANDEPSGLRLVINGSTCLFTAEYDPTRLGTDVAGRLARQLVPEGTQLKAGEAYAEIEVMKMYMPLTVGEAGTIHWLLSEGAALKPGECLGKLALDDPSAVVMAEVFKGKLDLELGPTAAPGGSSNGGSANAPAEKPHVLLRNAIQALEMELWGYAVPSDQRERAIAGLRRAVTDPLLPVNEYEEALAVLSGRVDAPLYAQLKGFATAYRRAWDGTAQNGTNGAGAGGGGEFPAREILPLIEKHGAALAERDRAAFLSMMESLRAVTEQYANGVAWRTVYALLTLARQYLDVERSFAGASGENALATLRKTHSGELGRVYDMCRSHAAVSRKNTLLLMLLDDIQEAAGKAAAPRAAAAAERAAAAAMAAAGLGNGRPASPGGSSLGEAALVNAEDMSAFIPVLTEIASMTDDVYRLVAAKARQLLLQNESPSIASRRQRMAEAVAAVVAAGGDANARLAAISRFASEGVPVRDLILSFFRSNDPAQRGAAAEIYLRGVYNANVVGSYRDEALAAAGGGCACGRWSFTQRSEGLPPGVTGASSFADLQTFAKSMSSMVLSSAGGFGGGGGGGGGSFVARGSSGDLSDSDSAAASDAESSSLGGGRLPNNVTRYGAVAIVQNISELQTDGAMEELLRLLPQYTREKPRCAAGPTNVLHVVLLAPPDVQGGGGGDEDDDAARQLRQMSVAAVAAAETSLHDEAVAAALSRIAAAHATKLVQGDVRRITFLVAPAADGPDGGSGEDGIPGIYTFRAGSDYSSEEVLFRHIEPSHAYFLDLNRLSNFQIRLATTSQAHGGNVHLYVGLPKRQAAKEAGLRGALPRRYFARVVSLTSEYVDDAGEMHHRRYYVEKMFVSAVNSLDLAVSEAEAAAAASGKKTAPPANNHIFINVVVPDHIVEPATVAAHMKELMLRFCDKISRLGVSHFEMKIVCRLSADTAAVPLRLVASNPTGYVVRVETYVEVREGPGNGAVFRAFGGSTGGRGGEWEGAAVGTPYPVARPFEQKRIAAVQRSDTLYCYDWLELLEAAAQQQWAQFARERPQAHLVRPSQVLHAMELVVGRRDFGAPSGTAAAAGPWRAEEGDALVLKEVSRPAGQNDVGMVAWLVTLRTPEYPEGRQLVLIANDITFQAGSFGTREDAVFLRASQYARAKGVPRLYLAANSGARIGMAESVKRRFRVAWSDSADPAAGFRYLYLSEEDKAALVGRGAVTTERVVDDVTGEVRHRILDVIGEEKDLGVENLRGSGTIAGETSVAYDDIFTLTLVVGRTVGIGAYLVRLAQRCIQNATGAPIVLTGHQALNTLMGREVYASNDQLGGGAAVMGPNGVTHLLAENHMESVNAALRWLSYVPRLRDSYLPVVDITGADMVERAIDFHPQRGVPYDPRHLVAGFTDELDGEWVSGFFDRGSFMETLPQWARTVVCGRARLGGIPMGVIVTESRTSEKKRPADPADLQSHESVSQQAGGVWYPDSAYKTAQAIRDIGGEGLPLMIFANWRGFSGGMRDMFDEVLKYGAMIVDALVAYKQPVFVYIPPYAELRGGAWVVVDSTINADTMEMYAAADHARGGVLEASGAAAIKFRHADLVTAAHRLDPLLKELDAKLVAAAGDAPALPEAERKALAEQVAEREKSLMGVYQQVAVQFADLHDTPGRMAAVGVIRAQVPWAQARSYFYWRLRRRLAEFDIRKQLMRAAPATLPREASAMVREWFVTMGNPEAQWEEDKAVLQWMASEAAAIKARVEQVKFAQVSSETQALVQGSPEAVLQGLLAAMDGLDKATKKAFVDRLSAAAQSIGST